MTTTPWPTHGFPWNSYFAHSWTHWPLFRRIRPRIAAAPVSFYRALPKLRWLHAYGVFPPNSMAPVRLVAIFGLDQLAHEAQKIRLLDSILVRQSEANPKSRRARQERRTEELAKKLWGVAHMTPLLRSRFTEDRFAPEEPERYPVFELLGGGAIARRRETG